MPRLPNPPYRLDLWTDVAAAGGTRLGFLVDQGGRAASKVQRSRYLEAGRSSLAFEVQPDYDQLAELAPHAAVVRFTRFVPTGLDSWIEWVEEWRVVQRARTVRGAVGAYRIRCVPIEDDLVDSDLWREVSSGGLANWRYGAVDRTPADILGDIAARAAVLGYPWIEVGTVTPTTPITISLDRTATFHAIVAAVVEALAAKGVDAEFQFTLASDLSAYRLELVTRVAGSLAPLRAVATENAPELDYDEDATEQSSVVVPFGADGIDLRELQFAAAAVDAGTGWITLEAIGGASAQLVAVDDQFIGQYLHRERTGRNFPITGASVSPPRLRVAVADLASGLAAAPERVSLRATEDHAGTRRAFGTRDRWSPAEVQSTLTAPARINVDDLYGAGVFVTATNQYRDWDARRSALVATLPSGDFNHVTGILDLGSAPGTAPQVDDWVWFDNGAEFVPGTVTGYNAGNNQITLVPRYAGTQFTQSKAGITSARCYRPVGTPMWITGSATTGDGQFTVDAFTGGTPSAGDVLEVIQRCQGTRLVELEDPAAVSDTRRKLSTLEIDCTGATNRVANADMAAWAGASGDPPDGWSIESVVGTVSRSRETDPTYTRHGGKSWKLDFATGASAEIFTPLIPINAVPGMDQVAAAVCLLFARFSGPVPVVATLYKVSAAGVRTRIRDAIKVYPLGTTVDVDGAYKAALETWYDAALPNMPIGDLADEQLQIGLARPAGASNAPCTLYVDIAMLLQRKGLPAEAEGGIRYVVGSDAIPMFVAGQVALQDCARPLVSYQGRLLNIQRLDGLHFDDYELVNGRDVALTIPALAQTRTVRLLGLVEDPDAPALAQVSLDRVRPDVGRLMASRLVPRVQAPAAVDQATQPRALPTLKVRASPSFTHVVISYEGSPRVTLIIDGGLEAAALPSPITVARNISGGDPKDYEFFARSDVPGVDPAYRKVVVAPQPPVDPAAPAITSITPTITFAPGDGGGEFDLDITVVNENLGTTYAYEAVVVAGPDISHGSAAASGIAIGSFPLSTITGCAMAPGAELQVTVTPSDPLMPPMKVTVFAP